MILRNIDNNALRFMCLIAFGEYVRIPAEIVPL